MLHIILNSKEVFDVLEISKQGSNYVIRYAYDIPKHSSPCYTHTATFPSIHEVHTYLDTFFEYLKLDADPPTTIDIQSDGFPCIVMNKKTYLSTECRGILNVSLEKCFQFQKV